MTKPADTVDRRGHEAFFLTPVTFGEARHEMLLGTTGIGVDAMAKILGYLDSRTFHRAFRWAVWMVPAEYRAMNGRRGAS